MNRTEQRFIDAQQALEAELRKTIRELRKDLVRANARIQDEQKLHLEFAEELHKRNAKIFCRCCDGSGQAPVNAGAPEETGYQNVTEEPCDRCHGTGHVCIDPNCLNHGRAAFEWRPAR